MSKRKGWIAFDLDGTTAKYDGWNNGEIGEPIKPMVDLIKKYLAEGYDVRIFTARISEYIYMQLEGTVDAEVAQAHMKAACQPIFDWCKQHIGRVLPVTCIKDFAMIKCYDDRAVQVEENTGRIIGG